MKSFHSAMLCGILAACSALASSALPPKVGGAKPYAPVKRSLKAAFWRMTQSPDGGRFALSDGL
ncbi:MAG: hypothetical protein NTU88_12060, partial [Armatimonadetes bacterium]|nr:hypothetical protein [Armatimonadota bacterium]